MSGIYLIFSGARSFRGGGIGSAVPILLREVWGRSGDISHIFMSDIKLIDAKINREELKRLIDEGFKDMVKYTVDVKQRRIAIGGELHADGEQLLLENGSEQKDIWGANYYPGKGEFGCIEYTSLINIRPSQGNNSMEITREDLREKIQEITFKLIGRGENL